MGNSVIFPAPDDKKVLEIGEDRLFFYGKPRKDENDSNSTATLPLYCFGDKKMSLKVPYLYFKEEADVKKGQYLIIYYHGNAELLNHTYKTLEEYHKTLRVAILSAEYPGYGLYDKEAPCEQVVLEDAELIIRHCITSLGYQEENIILFGRSLGTGIAARMGLLFPRLRGIIMISPYLSIRDIATNMIGGILARFVPDAFKTKDIIEYLKPPILFIHGLRDRLVPCTNSSYLYDHCNSPKMLNLSPTMDHNKFDFHNDIYLPILKFFVEKLDMTEFQEEYNNEDIGRVSALSSLENNDTKSSKSYSIYMQGLSPQVGYNFDKGEPQYDFVVEEEEKIMD